MATCRSPTRRALFDRALSFAPDLAVANGDHVYWDLWTALKYRRDAATRAKTAEQYHPHRVDR